MSNFIRNQKYIRMDLPTSHIGKEAALWLFIFLFLPSLLFCDVVQLKNGRRVEGTVRDAGNGEIIVETAGGIFSFKKDGIEKIEKSSNLANLLSQAKVEELKENYLRAIEMYSDALLMVESGTQKESTLKQLETVLHKYVDKIATHKPLDQGLNDIKEIEELKRKISLSNLLNILQSARIRLDNETAQAHYNEANIQENRKNWAQAIEHYTVILKNFPEHPLAQNLADKIAKLNLEYGEAEYKNARGATPEAVAAFQAVLSRDPNQPKALYYLGRIAVEANRFDEAKRYLTLINPADLPTSEQRSLSMLLIRVERALAPPPVETPRIIPTPAPVPTPEPSTSQKVTNWFNEKWSGIKEFFGKVGRGSGDVWPQLVEWGMYALYGLLAILIFWYVPMQILIRDLPKRKVIYYNWRTIINYTGLFGLLFYFIDRWRREEPRVRCPACNRAIDNPSLFDNYDFSVCPFCEKKIKPPFTLIDMIQSRAELMMATKIKASAPLDEAQREQMLEMIHMLMVHGRKIRASDIHIEPEETKLHIRYRVDGVMTETIPLNPMLHTFLVSCIKVVCNLNIAEKRLPQDGHFRRLILGEEINVRVSTIPTRLGEKVVLRLLDQKIATTTLDKLGMRTEVLEQYHTAITAPHGLILATGPTGSGKTTLLYSSLQFINNGSMNIVTVEDPIEYELPGINQIQHNTATGLTFATALRSILRQDPDVIMVGEIRDLETATIAVNSALTGHLVFSTLHTIDTSTALSRLIDIGVEVKLLSSALLCIVAQRLVRKLCPHCKKQVSVSARDLKRLGAEGVLLEGQPVYRARGCNECAGTGYIGRTGIYEMLAPNRDIRELIENGGSSLEVRQTSRQAGMKTLREEGAFKVLAGITSVDELIRVTTEDVFTEEAENKADRALAETDRVIPLEGRK